MLSGPVRCGTHGGLVLAVRDPLESLDTSHAFHSALLDPVLDEFESYASGFDYSSPQLALVCNRTGEVMKRRTSPDAQYWRRHARQPVRFAESVALRRPGVRGADGVGPQPILTAAAMRTWPDDAPTPRPSHHCAATPTRIAA